MRISISIGIRFLTMAAAASSAWLLLAGSTAQARPYWAADDIKLSGCLIRGEGDGGYLLTNAPDDPAWIKADDHKIAPSAVGTTGGFTTMFYWLYGNGDLNANVGRRVEVEGHLLGDLREGEIKTHRKDQWTEVTVSSGGRTMKARVPNASFTFVSDKDHKHKSDILVRRVNVDHVKMIGAGC